MTKKAIIITLGILICFCACTKERGRIESTKIQHNMKDIGEISFDENGDIKSVKIESGEIRISINIDSKYIKNFAISDEKYLKMVNIENGTIVSGEERGSNYEEMCRTENGVLIVERKK